jgi:hypothetical protein
MSNPLRILSTLDQHLTLASASFSVAFAGPALHFGYRYHHRFGRVHFTSIVQAHARHTSTPLRRDGEEHCRRSLLVEQDHFLFGASAWNRRLMKRPTVRFPLSSMRTRNPGLLGAGS